jgi:phospholipid:diacylglycerol acyltransferase
VTGVVAADYFVPGYFIWVFLIANLAHVGYEENNMYTAAYFSTEHRGNFLMHYTM